jgi:hypothetical protein
VVTGYRFIPLSRWPRLLLSVFQLHNETFNIHTHFLPLLIWGAAFYGLELPFPSSLSSFLPSPLASASSWSRYTPFAPPRAGPLPADEALFTLFALACLACSSLWHTMAGCAHKRGMETCARIDYVGIGWLIAMSIATVVHHGYTCAERVVVEAADHSGLLEQTHVAGERVVGALMHPVETLMHPVEALRGVGAGSAEAVEAGGKMWDALLSPLLAPLHAAGAKLSTLAAWPAYHPVGAACLVLCAAAGVSGNVLPFCDWFNRVENRVRFECFSIPVHVSLYFYARFPSIFLFLFLKNEDFSSFSETALFLHS